MSRISTFLVALALATAGLASAGNILVNPGFESGALAPWMNTNHYCGGPCTDWAPTTADAHSGLWSAMTDDNIEIFQSVTPTATSSISSVTFWLKQPDGGGISYVELVYSGGLFSNYTYSIGTDWTFIDATSLLMPGQTLVGFGLYGVTSPGAVYRTFLDDASIVASVPEPSSLVLLPAALAGLALLRRKRQS